MKPLPGSPPAPGLYRPLRPSGVVHLGLFLFLFAVYLLTYTPRINSSDGLAMFATAESLVRRGALDIEQIRWMGLQQGTYGLDGLLYSRKGAGLPLALLPLTWLGLRVPGWGPVGASLLFNAIVTALTAVLLLGYVQQLGFSHRTGLLVALLFGLATPAWPYAKSLFSDPFSGFLLLAAAAALLKTRSLLAGRPPSAGRLALLSYPFLAGLCLAWNVATRYAEARFVPLYGLLLLYYLWSAWPVLLAGPQSAAAGPPRPFRLLVSPAFWAILLAFALPLLLAGLALVAFNLFRYGHPFDTGYLPNETFSGMLWQGLLGQLLSPGRGLLLYSPVLFLSLWGAAPLFRRARPEALLAAGVILVHLFLYGKWFMWHGGYAWGPRFMVPTLPFWAVFLAPAAGLALARETEGPVSFLSPPPALLRAALAGLALLSLVPQLLGVAVDFSHFQNALLETDLPLFDPQTFFAFRYSPLLGSWAYLNRDTLDLAWAWQDRVNGLLLAVLGLNVVVAGLALAAPTGLARRLWLLPGLSLLLALTAVSLLLAHVHTLPAGSLRQAVAALNQSTRPGDAVITNDPDIATPFAELYRGRGPVLGLNNGGFPLPADINRRLGELIQQHGQVWWLPNWLPPEQSAVEQILLISGFRARNDSFDGQRLLLFAFPAELQRQALPGAVFGPAIHLLSAAYPQHSPAGAVLPVELQWQATSPPAEDYHVFIHLVNGAGETVAQADGQPAMWTRPTSTWREEEIIVDRHGLWLPPELPPGLYRLRLGLYRPTDGRRLLLDSGGDAILLEVTLVEKSL